MIIILKDIKELIKKLDKEYQEAIYQYDDPRAGALGYAIDELRNILVKHELKKIGANWFPDYEESD